MQRTIAIAEVKGINYEIQYISLKDKPEWFLKESPHGQVPILMTKQGTLFESNAISEYLDEAYPQKKLYPEDPFQKAIHRAWIESAVKHYLIQCSTQRSGDKDTLLERKAKLDKLFEKISKVLGNSSPYFLGNSLGMVDIAWFVLLHRTEIIQKYTGFDFLHSYEKLKEWRTSLLTVPALLRSISNDFEEAFANFYLSEKTYLGSLCNKKTA